MTIQPRPNNPIQKRKDDARKYSRNAALSVVGGLGGGFILALLLTPWELFLILGMIVAVVGGVYNGYKVRQIVNHKDNY